MRSLLLFLLGCVLVCTVYAQKVDEVYGYKKDWSPTDRIEVSTYIMHLIQEDDTTFSCRYYFTEGPLIKIETFKDSLLEIPHGLFAWYNKTGDLDSMGMVYEKKKDGYWVFGFDEKWNEKLSIQYDRGILVKRIEHQTGIVYMADGSSHPLTSEHKPNENEIRKAAEFKGGLNEWSKYLTKNLVIPERFNRIYRTKSKGVFKIGFEVDVTGKTKNLIMLHSNEWSGDEEVVRVIKESPLWIPATIDGMNVRYRHLQTITLGVRW